MRVKMRGNYLRDLLRSQPQSKVYICGTIVAYCSSWASLRIHSLGQCLQPLVGIKNDGTNESLVWSCSWYLHFISCLGFFHKKLQLKWVANFSKPILMSPLIHFKLSIFLLLSAKPNAISNCDICCLNIERKKERKKERNW